MSEVKDSVPALRRPRGRAGLIATIWVLGLLLLILTPVSVGVTAYNRVLASALTRAQKNSLHVVESQLQLRDIGQVQLHREFDNTVRLDVSTGGQSMQADLAVTGADVPNRLADRFRALGYTNKINSTRWDLGLTTILITPTAAGADVEIEVSAGN